MSITAKLKHLHIAPRKTRLVADLIRGKTVNQALDLLDFTPKKAAKPLYKLLKSAIANAISNDENSKIEQDNLYISKITVDQGPTNKRWRARSRGQTFGIQKKTSHINIVLDESPETSKKNEKIEKPAKPAPDAIEEKKEEKKEISVSETKQKKIKEPFYGEKKKFQPKIGKLTQKMFRRKSF